MLRNARGENKLLCNTAASSKICGLCLLFCMKVDAERAFFSSVFHRKEMGVRLYFLFSHLDVGSKINH